MMKDVKYYFKRPTADLVKRILLVIFGVILMGLGIAFIVSVGWGADPVSVLSDGIHKFFQIDLGMAVNIINCALFFIMLLFGWRYINVGTLINTFFLGTFIDFGMKLYSILNASNTLFLRIVLIIVSFLCLFFGIALIIAANIGLDVWSGLAMILRDWTHKEYKFFRVALDFVSLVIGFLLGGQIGVVTVIAAVLGGPLIQWFTKFIKKTVFKMINLKDE